MAELLQQPHNLTAFESILRHMSNKGIGYGAVNFPVDVCRDCGFNGIIRTDECDMCGGRRISRVRRITGYLSTLDMFNKSKRAEVAGRVTHT